VQDGLAVVEGAMPGTRVVVEGAQNLRPGSSVVETQLSGSKANSGNNVSSNLTNNYATNRTTR